jgi:plasmid stability protein
MNDMNHSGVKIFEMGRFGLHRSSISSAWGALLTDLAQLLCSTAMKNITLKIDEETYRKARVKAAAEGTSVSAMVRDFLFCETAGADDREARRIDSLEKLFQLAEARATPRATPLKPMTREEIYAERIR